MESLESLVNSASNVTQEPKPEFSKDLLLDNEEFDRTETEEYIRTKDLEYKTSSSINVGIFF